MRQGREFVFTGDMLSVRQVCHMHYLNSQDSDCDVLVLCPFHRGGLRGDAHIFGSSRLPSLRGPSLPPQAARSPGEGQGGCPADGREEPLTVPAPAGQVSFRFRLSFCRRKAAGTGRDLSPQRPPLRSDKPDKTRQAQAR